jgi:hypothetical protein
MQNSVIANHLRKPMVIYRATALQGGERYGTGKIANTRHGSAPRSRTDGETPRSRTDGKTPRSRTDGKTPRSRTDGETPRSRTDGETPRSRTDGKTPRSRTDGKTPRSRTDGPAVGLFPLRLPQLQLSPGWGGRRLLIQLRIPVRLTLARCRR